MNSTDKENKSFDDGFNGWMSACLEYEHAKQNGKKISKKLQRRMDDGFSWLRNLSDDEYSRLIH